MSVCQSAFLSSSGPLVFLQPSVLPPCLSSLFWLPWCSGLVLPVLPLYPGIRISTLFNFVVFRDRRSNQIKVQPSSSSSSRGVVLRMRKPEEAPSLPSSVCNTLLTTSGGKVSLSAQRLNVVEHETRIWKWIQLFGTSKWFVWNQKIFHPEKAPTQWLNIWGDTFSHVLLCFVSYFFVVCSLRSKGHKGSRAWVLSPVEDFLRWRPESFQLSCMLFLLRTLLMRHGFFFHFLTVPRWQKPLAALWCSENYRFFVSPPQDEGIPTLERLIRTHPVWYLPAVGRTTATQLLHKQPPGVSTTFTWNSHHFLSLSLSLSLPLLCSLSFFFEESFCLCL